MSEINIMSDEGHAIVVTFGGIYTFPARRIAAGTVVDLRLFVPGTGGQRGGPRWCPDRLPKAIPEGVRRSAAASEPPGFALILAEGG